MGGRKGGGGARGQGTGILARAMTRYAPVIDVYTLAVLATVGVYYASVDLFRNATTAAVIFGFTVFTQALTTACSIFAWLRRTEGSAWSLNAARGTLACALCALAVDAVRLYLVIDSNNSGGMSDEQRVAASVLVAMLLAADVAHLGLYFVTAMLPIDIDALAGARVSIVPPCHWLEKSVEYLLEEMRFAFPFTVALEWVFLVGTVMLILVLATDADWQWGVLVHTFTVVTKTVFVATCRYPPRTLPATPAPPETLPPAARDYLLRVTTLVIVVPFAVLCVLVGDVSAYLANKHAGSGAVAIGRTALFVTTCFDAVAIATGYLNDLVAIRADILPALFYVATPFLGLAHFVAPLVFIGFRGAVLEHHAASNVHGVDMGFYDMVHLVLGIALALLVFALATGAEHIFLLAAVAAAVVLGVDIVLFAAFVTGHETMPTLIVMQLAYLVVSLATAAVLYLVAGATAAPHVGALATARADLLGYRGPAAQYGAPPAVLRLRCAMAWIPVVAVPQGIVAVFYIFALAARDKNGWPAWWFAVYGITFLLAIALTLESRRSTAHIGACISIGVIVLIGDILYYSLTSPHPHALSLRALRYTLSATNILLLGTYAALYYFWEEAAVAVSAPHRRNH